MNTKLFDEYLQQFNDWQQKLVETWIESFPGGNNQFNPSRTIETALNLQQELVKTNLKAQEVTMQMAMETQKDFWDGYFDLIRRMPFLKKEAISQ